RRGGVERPADPLLEQAHDPAGEVADVDELHRGARRPRLQDRPAAPRAVRPVGEPVGGVVRADDQARPDEERSLAERRTHLLLAQGLQRAVVGVVVQQPVGWCAAELRRGVVLRPRLAVVGVVRDARDERVALGSAREQLRRLADDAGNVARRVDDGVPTPAAEGVEAPLAVAAQLLDLGEELGARQPAVERRHGVAALERRLDHRAAEEPRPAQQEQLHSTPPFAVAPDTAQTYRSAVRSGSYGPTVSRLRPLTESECYRRLYGDRDSTIAVIREGEPER